MKNKSFFDWSKRQAGLGFCGSRGALTGIFLFGRPAALIITCNEGGRYFNFTIHIERRHPQFYVRCLENRFRLCRGAA